MPAITDPAPKDKFFKGLFTGEVNCGKSVQAASFPGCYIFDFDGRIGSVQNHWVRRGKTDIVYDSYGPKDYKLYERKLNDLLNFNQFETIIFDSLTYLVEEILWIIRDFKGEQRDTGVKDKGKLIAGLFDVNTIEDYQGEESALNNLLSGARMLKCNVILTAHVIPKFNSNLRQIFTAGNKPKVTIPGAFNEIYHFRLQPGFNEADTKYIVRTKSDHLDTARTIRDLPEVIDLTNQSLYEKIKDKLDAYRGGDSNSVQLNTGTGQVKTNW